MEREDEESESEIFLNHYHYSGERSPSHLPTPLWGESTNSSLVCRKANDAFYDPSKDILVSEEEGGESQG